MIRRGNDTDQSSAPALQEEVRGWLPVNCTHFPPLCSSSLTAPATTPRILSASLYARVWEMGSFSFCCCGWSTFPLSGPSCLPLKWIKALSLLKEGHKEASPPLAMPVKWDWLIWGSEHSEGQLASIWAVLLDAFSDFTYLRLAVFQLWQLNDIYDAGLKPRKRMLLTLRRYFQGINVMYRRHQSFCSKNTVPPINRDSYVCIKMQSHGTNSEAYILLKRGCHDFSSLFPGILKELLWQADIWNTASLQTIKNPQWQKAKGSSSSNLSLCSPRWSLAMGRCILFNEKGLDKPNSCWCKSLILAGDICSLLCLFAGQFSPAGECI